MSHRTLVSIVAIAAVTLAHSEPNGAPERVEIRLNAGTSAFPHFWEQMFGSGRAVLSLRESYRKDLQTVKAVTAFKYVRFHAIFHDEIGLYDEDTKGNPIYNFSYVDQVYDGLLQNGIRPLVELSFMPRKLSSTTTEFGFWYKPLANPPKTYERWEELNYQLGKHLIARYGPDEVSKWYFEVWNEPNIGFWTGVPAEETYFELYDSAVHGLKHASERIRVGGPSTAQAAWVDHMIRHSTEKGVPLDFVSTHVYANDSSQDVFGTNEVISRRDMVGRAVSKVHGQILASSRPHIPLIWSEFNASYMNEPAVTDSPFIGPWLANTIRTCDGKVNMMSYWTFSDVFEEGGVVKTPFYGGFGLIAERGIPKASFNAFKLLHQLGNRRLHVDSEDVLATVRAPGTYPIAVWNYAPPEKKGLTRPFILHFIGKHIRGATISVVDPTHGNPLPTFNSIGKPTSPTLAQIAKLQAAGQLPPSLRVRVRNNTLTLSLPSWGLAMVVVD